EATAHCHRAIQLNPQFAPARLLLGTVLRRQGDHPGALAQFRKAAELNPRDPETQYDLGMELKSAHDLSGAIAAFQRAIAIKPDFEQAHYNLGITLHAQGQTEAGQKELDEINGLHEFRARLAQAKLLILKGVEALKQQHLDDAQASFQQAIEQSPSLATG